MRAAWRGAPKAGFLVLCAAALVGSGMLAAAAPKEAEEPGPQPRVQPVKVGWSVKNDVSPPLRSITPIPPEPWTTIREMPEPSEEGFEGIEASTPVEDPVVQRSFGKPLGPPSLSTPIQNFEGMNNIDGVYPPDTNGDVGPNHYVQWVNLHFEIFSKTGQSLYGPAGGYTLWSGFGHPCDNHNNGDPIALYDPIADRWLMSQFVSSSPYGQCVAVSTSPDPTGSYYRYYFPFSELYDYPKLGVWPDAYYMSGNRGFGSAAIAFDRQRMLQGLSATFQEFDITSFSGGTLLPSDLDGRTLPPAGSPAFFANREGTNNINLFKFHVDWSNPSNSSLTGPVSLSTASFNSLCPGTRNCVPQPGTSRRLDALGDRLMHRLAYRNFGDHESLVLNHAVDVGGPQAGVRWYEIRSPNTSPFIYQQGSYAPDSTNRWMASIAMDSAGNIGMGFNISSGSVYPGIRYTGRLATDPLGQMTQGENTLISGGGSQTGSASRWGDYASLSVDPVDDCTFWFTGEYMASTSIASWQTRIGSFKFDSCPACTDTDGDGACDAQDCAPNNVTAFAIPAEVTGLRLAADRVTLVWDSAAPGAGSGTVHDVPRGDLDQLPVGNKPSETCLAHGIAPASTTDPAVPATGKGFWYLVRGRNSCGAGSYGTQSNGTQTNTSVCP